MRYQIRRDGDNQCGKDLHFLTSFYRGEQKDVCSLSYFHFIFNKNLQKQKPKTKKQTKIKKSLDNGKKM